MKKECFLIVAFLCSASAAGAKDDFKSLDAPAIPKMDPAKMEGMKDFPSEEEGTEVKELPIPKLKDIKEFEADAAAAAQKEHDAKGYVTFSAAVNTIRRSDRTEVMFRNGDSYYLPSGGKHNEFYKICEESEKNGQAVSVVANPKSKVIVKMSGASAPPKQK
jgi:hypothetical protein